MIIRKFSEIDFFEGFEGSKIKQYFGKEDCFEYSLAYLELLPNKKTRNHKLESNETYFIISGTARIHINGIAEILQINDSVMIPKNTPQFIENIGDENLRFLCIVEPPWSKNRETFLE